MALPVGTHDSSSRWSDLPAEIMQQIVQHLPLQDRLVSCALISTAWAAAEAAAPRSCVDLVQEDADSLQQAWQRCLAKLNCQQLTSVRLAIDDPFSNSIRYSWTMVRGQQVSKPSTCVGCPCP